MTHNYAATVTWSAAEQGPTTDYKSYGRGYRVSIAGRPDLLGSSDPAFRGDASKHNPEDLLLAALSGCHLLWYLHLCSQSQISVLDYRDDATAEMELERGGGGQFVSAVLRPRVTLAAEGETLSRLAFRRHDRTAACRQRSFVSVSRQAGAAPRCCGERCPGPRSPMSSMPVVPWHVWQGRASLRPAWPEPASPKCA